MGELFDAIRQLMAEEKCVVGQHTSKRLEERGIMEWQESGMLQKLRTPNRRVSGKVLGSGYSTGKSQFGARISKRLGARARRHAG